MHVDKAIKHKYLKNIEIRHKMEKLWISHMGTINAAYLNALMFSFFVVIFFLLFNKYFIILFLFLFHQYILSFSLQHTFSV